MNKTLFKSSMSLICAFSLCACVNVDIKTEIPEMSFYDITIQNTQSQGIANLSYGVVLSASMPYDSTDIFKLDSQSLQIKAIPSAQWVAKPKEMLFSSFVAEMNAKGLNVIRPPFGSANLNAYLKLHIDRILIIQKDGKELATITLNYEIFDTKTLKLKKSGTLTQEAQITNKDFAPVFYKVSESVLQSLVDELLVP